MNAIMLTVKVATVLLLRKLQILVCYVQEAVAVSTSKQHVLREPNQGVMIVSLHWLCRLRGTSTCLYYVLSHF